ncbi:ribosome maturation factor RimP [Candidatus Profftia sp. (ex Adelges kitamiensis)]|uniref:ribosome maturation factor RimP n=1 Tax=Candidatus Profftia sp. (ex Adelges kitamiensis) TaxID=2864218 RepID=UPI001CE32A3B|nr:ribosome maturation factor RimP [Candidatus Profftia sp. (ex Adelges kitamiensis)]
MSILKNKLTEIISTPIQTLGFEFIGIQFIRSSNLILRIYIDNEKGINVNDCANVSHKISTILNAQDPIRAEYNLEISSPGINRPMFTPAHYIRFMGEEVVILLFIAVQKHYRWQGIIKDVKYEMITITVDEKDQVFALNNIKNANLVPHY